MKRRVPKRLVRTAEWPYAKAEPVKKGFNYEEAEKAQTKNPVNTLRIINMKGKQPGDFIYSDKDRVYIGSERDLRWLASFIHTTANLPRRRMELKTFKGELVDIYEFD